MQCFPMEDLTSELHVHQENTNDKFNLVMSKSMQSIMERLDNGFLVF